MRPPHAELRRRGFRGHRTGRTIVLLACIGVALVLGAVARSATSPALTFAAAKSYAIGKGPASVAIGDLNGDGKPDLVTANHDADSVSVLLNRGDGTFEPKGDYATAGRPISVEIADLTADGRPDLMVAANSSFVSVLLNRGDGRFEPRRDYATGGGVPERGAAGDLNGDGALDLVTANGDGDTVSVLINRGDGSFNPARDYATGEICNAVAIADLNGDGALDLVTANAQGGSVSVFMNHGDGSFEPKHDYSTATGFSPVSLGLGDLNADGKPDIVTANYGGGQNGLSVLLNRGDGSFRANDDYETGGGFHGGALFVAIADLNGDGKPDLATKNGAELSGTTEVKTTVSVLLNRGAGTFGGARNYRTGYDEGTSEHRLAVIDLNGDGKPDLATPNSAQDWISVLLNKGDGSFESRLNYRTRRSPVSVVTADLNGDDKPDAVTANTNYTVSVLLNMPGLCNVQDIRDMTVRAAKRKLARVNCRVGKVARVYSVGWKKGRVISQKPKIGAVLPGGGKVNLVISRGRRT